MCFHASVSAIGVLGKLILQVTDSLLLRQNCGLQILNLLQQPLQQLRLDRRRVEERKQGEQKEKEKKTVTGKGEIKGKEKEEKQVKDSEHLGKINQNKEGSFGGKSCRQVQIEER